MMFILSLVFILLHLKNSSCDKEVENLQGPSYGPSDRVKQDIPDLNKFEVNKLDNSWIQTVDGQIKKQVVCGSSIRIKVMTERNVILKLNYPVKIKIVVGRGDDWSIMQMQSAKLFYPNYDPIELQAIKNTPQMLSNSRISSLSINLLPQIVNLCGTSYLNQSQSLDEPNEEEQDSCDKKLLSLPLPPKLSFSENERHYLEFSAYKDGLWKIGSACRPDTKLKPIENEIQHAVQIAPSPSTSSQSDPVTKRLEQFRTNLRNYKWQRTEDPQFKIRHIQSSPLDQIHDVDKDLREFYSKIMHHL